MKTMLNIHSHIKFIITLCHFLFIGLYTSQLPVHAHRCFVVLKPDYFFALLVYFCTVIHGSQKDDDLLLVQWHS
jgi:hypothetical protein